MREYKIKETKKEYYEEDGVLVEILDGEKSYTTEIGTIKETIKTLEQRKKYFIEKIDTEIKENQDILDSVLVDVKKIQFAERTGVKPF